jgi:hypothetical protein
MYQPIILPHFYRQLKDYAKKYRHLRIAVIEVLENFDQRRHVYLGHGIYKVRLKTKDVAKGKSKSFRLIILILEVEKFIVPLVIYFKSDRQDMNKKEINNHLETILLELRLYNQ